MISKIITSRAILYLCQMQKPIIMAHVLELYKSNMSICDREAVRKS